MKKTLEQLLKEFDDKGKEAQKLLENPELTMEDTKKVGELNGQRSVIQAQIKAMKETDALDNWAKETDPEIEIKPTTKDVELLGFTSAGYTDLEFTAKGVLKALEQNGAGIFGEDVWAGIKTTTYKKAFSRYLRLGSSGLSSGDRKDLEIGADPQGGYLAPPEWVARLLSRDPAPTRLAGNVMTLSTSRSALEMPKLNYSADNRYTTPFRVKWTGEHPVTPAQGAAPEHRVNTTNLFGSKRIDVYTAMLSAVMTNDMVEDSAFPLEAWIQNKFQETVDLVKDDMILNGTGIGQPTGMLVAPGTAGQPAVVNSGNANTLTPDGLVSLAYTLPEQYESNAKFVLNKTNTGKAVATLKDGDDRYLFSDNMGNQGLATARPSQLLGYPYLYSAFAPDVAANAYPVVFGDPMGYCVVNRIGLVVQVLRELYAEQNGIGLVGRIRFGGMTLEEWKLLVQKVAA